VGDGHGREPRSPQGPVAEAIAELWWLLFGLGVAVFVAFGVLLVLGLFRRGPPAGQESGRTAPSRLGRWVVGGGVVLPLLVLVVVFGATVQAMRVIPNRAPSEALVVEVVGHQWSWEVRYPAQGITTTNQLHIPVGRPVALTTG
jgi:cytochrome c oxidase subunit II